MSVGIGMRGVGILPKGGVITPTKWNVDAAGNWETASNWKPAKVPNKSSAYALLAPIITAPRTVTLTTAKSVKSLAIDSSFAYTVAGASLTASAIKASGAGQHVVSAPIAGTTWTKSGAGTLIISGANTYSSDTIISAGTLKIGAASTIPAASRVTGSGVLDLSSFSATVGGLDGSLGVVLGANTLTVNCAGSCVYGGVISGTGGLTKTGAGNLTLDGVNTFSGALTISTGTVTIGTGAVPNISSLVVNGGFVISVPSDGTTAVPISGTGTFTKNGAAKLTLAGTNSFSGTYAINAGSIASGSAGAINGCDVALANATGAALDLTAFNGTVRDLSGGGALGGNVLIDGKTFTVGGTASTTYDGVISGTLGAFTKVGSGTLTVTRPGTYTGMTTISAGTLKLGVTNWETGEYTLSAGGTLDLNGFSQTVAGIMGTGGTVTSNNGACTLTFGDADADTFSGVFAGPLNLIKAGAGTDTLSGANTFTGTLAINVGNLLCGANSVLPSTCAITTANTAGVALDLGTTTQSILSIAGGGSTGGGIVLGTGATLTINNTSATSFSGLISGAGNLTHAGTGQFTIALSATFTGTLTVNNGATISGAATSATGLGPLVMNSGSSLKKDTNARTFNNSVYTFNAGTITIDPNTSNTLTLSTGLPTFAGNVTLNIPQNQVSLTLALAESGAGGYDLIKIGAGTLKINAASATRTGNVYINEGVMASGSGTGWTTAGTIFLGDTTGSSPARCELTTATTARALTVRSGSSGAKSIGRNSGNPTLSGAFTVNDDVGLDSGGGTLTFSGTLSGAGGLRAITSSGVIAVTGATKTSFTGSIYGDSGSQNINWSGGATGASGTASIQTSGSYTGVIFINSTFTGTGTSTISAGGIGGTSSVGGSVVINSGGSIRGGSGASNAGTFSIGGTLTMNTGGVLNINIGSVTTVGLVAVTGAVTLNSNVVNFQAANLNAGVYTIMTCAGTPTGTLVLGTLPSNRTGCTFQYLNGSITATLT